MVAGFTSRKIRLRRVGPSSCVSPLESVHLKYCFFSIIVLTAEGFRAPRIDFATKVRLTLSKKRVLSAGIEEGSSSLIVKVDGSESLGSVEEL